MSRFPKIEISKLRDKQLARIRIKNKLYGGRRPCEMFHFSLMWEIQSAIPDRIVARYLGDIHSVMLSVDV